MDIRDLSIGDWVALENQPFKVIGINPPYVDLLCNGRLRLSDIDNDNLSPIPLTPEILLKNGFKEHIFPDQYINAEKCTIVRAGKEWDFNSAIEEYRFIGKYQSLYGLQFVHELQHALRVAGITREFVV